MVRGLINLYCINEQPARVMCILHLVNYRACHHEYDHFTYTSVAMVTCCSLPDQSEQSPEQRPRWLSLRAPPCHSCRGQTGVGSGSCAYAGSGGLR